MHWYIDFRDPVSDPARTPTLYEWCGGLPALTRTTHIFYEKHVPADPILAPLFANMSPDHPERVAKWLGEVFGGPPTYSEELGGYQRMLSQHVGKGLTEEQRARWASLISLSAQEAGLPADPEFRSAFSAYIEWGSRLAVANSQPGAKPPLRMPVPRWDWGCAGSPEVSSSPPAAAGDPGSTTLPTAGEPVTFEKHIKGLFRSRDRQSMKFAFDLWEYADVKRHADAILECVRAGSMPCDGAWPQETIDVFKRWYDSGMPE
jgi:truncated hemoglobin YjbI